QWMEKKKQSVDAGYRAFRATGDMAWLEKQDWPEFMAYEAAINRAFPQRMTGLCTYLLDGCPAEAVLHLVRNHQLTLMKIAGEWEVIEGSGSEIADSVCEQLQRLSADVLEQKDNERRWISNQLHEGTAQNVAAISIYLANLRQRKSLPPTVK